MLFKFNQSILDWTALSWIFVCGFFETFLEGSVDRVIYRDYIVNWRFFIYCSLTTSRNAEAGLEFAKSQRAVENREKRRKLVVKSSVVP